MLFSGSSQFSGDKGTPQTASTFAQNYEHELGHLQCFHCSSPTTGDGTQSDAHSPWAFHSRTLSSALWLHLIRKHKRCWTSTQTLKGFCKIQETLAYEYHSPPSGSQIIIRRTVLWKHWACAMGLVSTTSLLLMLGQSCRGVDMLTLWCCHFYFDYNSKFSPLIILIRNIALSFRDTNMHFLPPKTHPLKQCIEKQMCFVTTLNILILPNSVLGNGKGGTFNIMHFLSHSKMGGYSKHLSLEYYESSLYLGRTRSIHKDLRKKNSVLRFCLQQSYQYIWFYEPCNSIFKDLLVQLIYACFVKLNSY